MKLKNIIILAFAALALGGPRVAMIANEASVENSQSAGAAKPDGVRRAPRAVPDSYVVVLSADQDAEAVARETARVYAGQLRRVYRKSVNGFAIQLTAAAAERLAHDSRVRFVEEDGVVTLQQAATTWGLDRIDQHLLPLDSIFHVSATGVGVAVHVLDTGIRTTHNEFGGRASIAADYVGDGWSGVDCNGHGTHVAGTIGGASFGVAKNVTIYAHRVLDCSGNGSTAAVIEALEAVAMHPARPAVANMSLGGAVSSALDEAIRNSIAAGVTFVVAAGNQNSDAWSFSPARVEEAVTVGATNEFDQRGTFSNYGTALDLFAPGVNVLSAWLGSDTATNVISGTSMAAPHVTGAAALYLEVHPSATPAEVRDALVAAATPGVVLNPGVGSPNRLLFVGGEGTPPEVAVVAPVGGEKLYASTPFTIQWTATDSDGFHEFDVMVSLDGGVSYGPVANCSDVAASARSCVWMTPAPVSKKARIKVIARDSLGAVGSAESSANFSIGSGAANVKVTSPNGSVPWALGSTQLIAWTHNLGVNSFMRVELSRDGGVSFPEVLVPAVQNTAASSGSYAWNVTGPLTASAMVRVSWTSGAASDVSDTPFDIATASIAVKTPSALHEDWGYASTHRVRWTTNLPASSTVNILLSTDGGTSYPTTLASNVSAAALHADVVAPTLGSPTTAARVRVVWSNPPAGYSAVDDSIAFKITPAFVTLTKPNGGETWTAGGQFKVGWKSNLGALENVRLELSTDGGVSYGTTIVASTPGDGTYNVTINGAWVTPTARLKVTWLDSAAVSDVSNNVFVIQ